jgi:hypothetical protein
LNVDSEDLSLWQASTVLTKRIFAAAHDAGASQGGALQLATAFPRPVWLDHLLPLLEIGGAVTLRATCKATRAIVADTPADLGNRPVEHLKAVLTCFPKAVTVVLYTEDTMTPAEKDSLIEWLQGRANSLTCIDGERQCVEPFHRRAWRAGVCKAVKLVRLNIREEEDRDLIIDGVVSSVESMRVKFSDEVSPIERAALGYLRHLRAPRAHGAFKIRAFPPSSQCCCPSGA